MGSIYCFFSLMDSAAAKSVGEGKSPRSLACRIHLCSPLRVCFGEEFQRRPRGDFPSPADFTDKSQNIAVFFIFFEKKLFFSKKWDIMITVVLLENFWLPGVLPGAFR
jgi:hypothetical protein